MVGSVCAALAAVLTWPPRLLPVAATGSAAATPTATATLTSAIDTKGLLRRDSSTGGLKAAAAAAAAV